MERAAWLGFVAGVALLPWATWPPFPWIHEHAQWSDVLFAAAAAMLLLDALRRRALVGGALEIALGGWLLWALVSLAFSPEPAVGVAKLAGMVELAALLLLSRRFAASTSRRDALVRTVTVTSLGVCLAAVAGVLLYETGTWTRLIGTHGDLVTGDYARAQAALHHPNLLGSYCIFASAVVARERITWLRRLVQGALLVTVLLAMSRALVGFLLAALLRRLLERGARRAALLTVGAAGLALLALSLVNLRVDPTSPFEAGVDREASPRVTFVQTSWRTLMQHPIVGSGPGTAPAVWRGEPRDAHLTPLHVAATMGVPALILLAAVVAAAWRGRARPTDVASWTGLLALGLDGMTQDADDFRHVWLLLGLAANPRDHDRP